MITMIWDRFEVRHTEYRIQNVFIVNQIKPLYYNMLLFTINVRRQIYFTNLYSYSYRYIVLIQSHYRNIMRTGLLWLNNVASPRSKAFTRTHTGNNRIRWKHKAHWELKYIYIYIYIYTYIYIYIHTYIHTYI